MKGINFISDAKYQNDPEVSELIKELQKVTDLKILALEVEKEAV